MAITPSQKQAIEEVLRSITSAIGAPRKRQLAGMFLELVDRHTWPEYYQVIPEPRCLNGIQAMLEKNRYKDPLDAYTDLSLVFLNALFYNEPESQISLDAQTLKSLLISEWKSKALPTPRDSPPPSSAQKVHAPLPPPPAPTPTPAPAAKISLPPALPPAPIAPIPSTSNPVHSQPPAILPYTPPPVEPSPAPESPESESESEVEELTDGAYGPASGAPTDTQIVRQLERGLPRYAPLLGEGGGWMADVKHERHLEIVQAIKAYRDAAGVKLSQALDGVPEDKMPITFKLLESRSRSKTFYTSSRPFDFDVARMFECGRRYYLGRGGGVAGEGGEEWRRVLALQRVAHALTSAHPPPQPLPQPLVIAPSLQAPGTRRLDSIAHKGFVLAPGDYVHVSPATENIAPGAMVRPIIARVVGCWRDDAGEGGVSVRWYLRADELRHLISRRSIGAIEGEVVRTDKTTHHVLADVLEKVACQHVSSAPRGRPRAPAWYPGWPLYVCGYRVDPTRGRLRRIRRAEWFGTQDADAHEALDLFERPVRLGGQQPPQGAVADRSVVTAAGLAVSATEKLPPETKRHFERDPTTGEVLWFPGPPMHLARAPPPRHRLEYLHFLAKKYHPDLEPRTVVVNGDDPMGGDSGAADADVEMGGSEPPAKRQKIVPQEVYLSASERIRQALRAFEAA
ncbi:hypothetical protein B0H15DRAFT_289076 [Mycena belliarum]|uniref:Uncharacterized protein n=1 Tax=Mycena belliarum TaxID=1033014 RepID=A0AAD6U2L7_9AGAR|nr:hypothetical protein B0H15DRAFT_289076 [Mycena belliae]